MRSFLLSLLISPILRSSSTSYSVALAKKSQAVVFPPLEYPICRRNFTCAAPLKQDFSTIMADLSKEQQEEVDRMSEPAAPCEGEILGKNDGREEALK